MLSYLSKCAFRVPSKINSDWFNPNINLVKRRNWIVLFVRFSIQWNFKDSLSFSLIRIWRKAFSMSAHKITSLNVVLIRMSHNLFWRDGPFSRQSLREYPDRDLAEASYTALNFVDSAFCLITGLCGRKNSFGFSLWFSETFSITLFTNWSLITWSYALDISVFCSSRFKRDFKRPRLPELLLFKGTLFSFHTRPVSYQPPSFLSSCYLNFLCTFSSWLKWFSFTPITSISHRRSKSLTDVLVYSELTKSLSLPGDIMTPPTLVYSAMGSLISSTLGHFCIFILT